MSGPKSAQMVLQNPSVDTAVFEVARGGILREGLGYDRNDVAVVTNVTGDHLGPRRHPHAAPAGRRQGRRGRGRAPLGHGRAQRRRSARGAHGAPLPRPDRLLLDGHRPRARTAGCASTRTADAAAPPSASRRPTRASWSSSATGPRVMPLLYTPPHPGHLRRPRPDERRQRPRGGRCGLGRRRPHARHPPGPADVLDLVLPGAGPPEHDRDERLPGDHRLLPQRRRHAAPGRVRGPAHGRRRAAAAAGPGSQPQRGRRDVGDGAKAREVETPKRSGRAIGIIGIPGDRPNGDQREYGALAAGAFDRIYVREDRNLRGRKPGESAGQRAGRRGLGPEGAARRGRSWPSRCFDEMDAARRALAEARAGRPDRRLCRRRRRCLPGGDGAQPSAAPGDGHRGPRRDGRSRGLTRRVAVAGAVADRPVANGRDTRALRNRGGRRPRRRPLRNRGRRPRLGRSGWTSRQAWGMFLWTVRTTHRISRAEMTTRMTPTMASTGPSSPSARMADLCGHHALPRGADTSGSCRGELLGRQVLGRRGRFHARSTQHGRRLGCRGRSLSVCSSTGPTEPATEDHDEPPADPWSLPCARTEHRTDMARWNAANRPAVGAAAPRP